jgi:hypothetical protein
MRHFGWSGLLIEANPYRCERIVRDFTGLDYKLVNVAISNRKGEGTLFLGVHDEISSLHHGVTASYGAIREQLSVIIERLPDVLLANNIPTDFGLLSVETEFEDIIVLNDVIEEAGYSPKLPLTKAIQTGYKVIAKTNSNLILEQVRQRYDAEVQTRMALDIHYHR